MPATDISPQTLSLCEQKGIAVLLLLGKPDREISAPPSGLAIACVSEAEDLRSYERAILAALINPRIAYLERAASIQGKLSQLVAEGNGLEGLAAAMMDFTGCGVLIQDKRLEVLAAQPINALVNIWGEMIDHLSSVDSLPEGLRDRKQAGQQSQVLLQELPGGLARFVSPIQVSGVARGYLSLISAVGELDELDQLVIEQGCQVCAVEMSRSKAIHEAEKRLKGNLLTALLQETLSPRDARLWVQAMGLDLSQAHVSLRFAWDGPSAPSRRRLETLVNGEVSRLGFKVIVSPMGAEVVCFCEIPGTSSRPEPALALAQSILEREAGKYPDNYVMCGIGSAAHDLSEWQTSFRQAGQALEMARRLGEHKPYYFPDLSVYRLLLQMEHNPELKAFLEETIGPLLDYEAGNELVHTLEVYFAHHGNLSQTAEALYIHRNTLIYRMDRIAEILKVDLDIPENRLAVQLALQIARMTGRTHQ